jgi:hypothetical protein
MGSPHSPFDSLRWPMLGCFAHNSWFVGKPEVTGLSVQFRRRSCIGVAERVPVVVMLDYQGAKNSDHGTELSQSKRILPPVGKLL